MSECTSCHAKFAYAKVCPACGAKQPMSVEKKVGIGIAIGVVVLIAIAGSPGGGSTHPNAAAAATAPVPREPVESDHDVLLRETKSEAPYAGEEIIKTVLKAPTQAKFSDRELVRVQDNFALVRMTVDAPNVFGVMLRQKWCATVVFQPPRGDSFSWNKTFGSWRCDEALDEDETLTREAMVKWPGAAEELAARHPGKRHPRKESNQP